MAFWKRRRKLKSNIYMKLFSRTLYSLHVTIANILRILYNTLWCAPLFKSRCTECGTGLMLPNGLPHIDGNHLKLYLGSDVTIVNSSLAASHLTDSPTIKIGNRTVIGPRSDFNVALEVIIGDDVLIAKDCFISDNDPQSGDPGIDASPIEIGNNVCIGPGCCILKGSRIGDNSIIAANSVVVGPVWRNCLYSGSPARFVCDL